MVAEVARYADAMRFGIDIVASNITSGVKEGILVDVAHIGNTGAAYPWTPALVADVDLWCLVDSFVPVVGQWLDEVTSQVRDLLAPKGTKLIARAIDGPYKPIRNETDQPILFAHLLIDTPATYMSRNALTRWSWRKYECVVVSKRLSQFAQLPSLNDLITADWGIDDCIVKLRSNSVSMYEWRLPPFVRALETLTIEDPEFLEFCFYAATTCARNHARILRLEEADRLPNESFFIWYQKSVLKSPHLSWIVDAKTLVREHGAVVLVTDARDNALAYLDSLRETLYPHLA